MTVRPRLTGLEILVIIFLVVTVTVVFIAVEMVL